MQTVIVESTKLIVVSSEHKANLTKSVIICLSLRPISSNEFSSSKLDATLKYDW